ncbi:MAG: multicopper oxidase family protein [Acidimicrobiales bacterium]
MTPAPRLTRRAALGLFGAGTASVVLAGCGLGDGDAAAPTGPTGSTTPSAGGALPVPTELRSTGGLLDVDLVAAPVQLPWGDRTRYALAFNGAVPGPTLRVHPGDTLRITLRNELGEPTNLHTHGLHVSPEGTGDDVFVMVDPGGSHRYEYQIPADHPPGLFWYHPHHHGTVAGQVSAGMAGAIVVDDGTTIPATERILVLSDPRIGSTAAVLDASAAERQQGREGDAILVNGAPSPTVEAAAGSTERWRILNASPSRFYRLRTGATMTQIGTDQGPLDQARSVDELLLVPGQRADLLVPVGTDPLTLATEPVERGGMGGRGTGGMGGMGGMGRRNGSGSTTSSAGTTTLLTVRPSGTAPPDTTAPTTLPAPPRPSVERIDRRRTVSLGAMGMGAGQLVIDGRSFSPDRIDTTAQLGTVEEWTLTNDSMMDHPFHIHVWPFVVTERSDGTPDPGWRDTVDVPAGGSVTVRIPFTDLGGTTVYHCHILDHEDLGMMATIRAT